MKYFKRVLGAGVRNKEHKKDNYKNTYINMHLLLLYDNIYIDIYTERLLIIPFLRFPFCHNR